MEHFIERKQLIDRPRAEVFDFFADAGNLERITPPELNFHIITPQPIDIRKGALIDYRLKLRGIPITWKTEITQWNPPFDFVDSALKSPYKQWIHLHTFEEDENGKTMMTDLVRYRLPFEPLGDLAHFLVRRELENIFDFRFKVIAGIFVR
ncbi:MAG: SRPBCC family protein [Acidobacteria bacterium]|nr:SRPBCC family protein [Acidobacteriota bacterium]MBK8149683.1 SRPBCC family protein [Acidobacteriota bacterium]MBK8809808.1 SRPBCC family protein [Acidobacteriota bacterium]